jgi:methanogenic corrinoid protein MtbC1
MVDVRYEQLTRTLADVDEPQFEKLVAEILAQSPSPETIDRTFQAVQAGMEEVGKRFQEGDYFLAEMLFAAEMVNGLMAKISPYLEQAGHKKLAKIVLGTASGDIHDIGKNLVGVLLTATGFEVVDLGTDVSPARFVDAIRTHQPQIVGISGLLTLSIEPMRETVDAINGAGLREQVKIIIGGNPITEQIHREVGSDAWVNNAAEGVDICRAWAEA